MPLWQHMMVGHRVVDLFVPKTTPRKTQEPEEKLSRNRRRRHRKLSSAEQP